MNPVSFALRRPWTVMVVVLSVALVEVTPGFPDPHGRQDQSFDAIL